MKKLPRFLIRIEAVLIVVSILFSVILTANELSKKHLGIWFEVHIEGASMLPTIAEGSLVLLKSVPFDDLEIGDCIQFKMRVNIARVSTKTRLVPAGNDDTVDTTPAVVETSYPVLYEPDKYVLHRIVAKTDEGFITKGDHNSENDPYPVIADEYTGKVIWTQRGLGWPFRLMYMNLGLFWVMGASALIGAGLAVAHFVIKSNKPE